ncbi:MAG: hypothetical protein Fur0017_20790 [Anaerolineales bacterium]
MVGFRGRNGGNILFHAGLTLAELEEQGMVTKEVIEREERLDMKIYHITEAGRAELHT